MGKYCVSISHIDILSDTALHQKYIEYKLLFIPLFIYLY